MALMALFVSATKLAGVLVTLTVAANAFSFSRFRKRNLRPFKSPIDESADTLAIFNVSGGGKSPGPAGWFLSRYGPVVSHLLACNHVRQPVRASLARCL